MSCTLRLAALGLAAATTAAGCSSPALSCVDVDAACQPLYPPSWDNVDQNTIAPKCGVGGSSCHGGVAPHGGLRLDDPPTVFANLTAADKDYVLPGEPSCSQIIERVRSSFSSLRMPKGSRLPASEACSLEQWIAAGAPGPATVAP